MSADEIARIIAADTVLLRREHPELVGRLNWLVARGELTAVLPGVYTAAGLAAEPLVRIAAAARRDPDAVFVGMAAARLSFWPDAPLREVEVAVARARQAHPGFQFCRRRIPPELLVQRAGLRLTSPSLTALDLAGLDCTDALDLALRKRVVTLASLRHALDLTKGRPGNRDRRRVVLDSRDEPWSRPERLCHRLLRGARITGWRSNVAVRCGDETYYLDIAFKRQRVAIEIDGRQFHDTAEAFESDRRRQNALVLHGWTVLRITWQMLQNDPDAVLDLIRTALAGR